MLKSIAKSVAEGRGISGASLPVRIFEPRSNLSRVMDMFSYAPIYLTNLNR